jgi:hypothetical protein
MTWPANPPEACAVLGAVKAKTSGNGGASHRQVAEAILAHRRIRNEWSGRSRGASTPVLHCFEPSRKVGRQFPQPAPQGGKWRGLAGALPIGLEVAVAGSTNEMAGTEIVAPAYMQLRNKLRLRLGVLSRSTGRRSRYVLERGALDQGRLLVGALHG